MVQAFSREKAAVGGLKIYQDKWVPWYNERRLKRVQEDKEDNAVLLAKKSVALKEEQNADKAISEYKKQREERLAKQAISKVLTAGKPATVVKPGPMSGIADWSKRFAGISPEDEQEIRDAQLMQKALEMKMKATDIALTKMPSGANKDRLLQKRDESRGFFMENVAPLWNKFSSFFTMSGDAVTSLPPNEYDATFGILPLLIWGGVVLGGVALSAAAVMAAGAYLTKARQQAALEDQILKDPSLSATQKSGLITTARDSGSILSSLPSPKILIPIGIAAGIGLVLWKIVIPRLIPGMR
jgi:hypothetical protein